MPAFPGGACPPLCESVDLARAPGLGPSLFWQLPSWKESPLMPLLVLRPRPHRPVQATSKEQPAAIAGGRPVGTSLSWLAAAAVLVLAGSACPSAGAPETSTPAPRVLTLEDSIAIALENNRSIQTALDRLDRAVGRVGEARASGRLQARAEASLTRNDQETAFSLPGGEGGPARQVTISPLYTRAGRFSVTQPIDISGAIRASRNIADLGVLAARLDVERAQEQTVLDVKTAFFQVLRAQAALEVAQATVASLEDHLRQAQAFQRAGVAARFDVLRAETQVANARQNVIAARNAVELAKASLNTVMGIDVNTPLTVRYDEAVEVEHPDYQQSVTLAYERRAEVKQARVNVEAAQRGVSLARSSGRPSLGLSWLGNLTLDGGAFSPRSFQWNATAVLSMPILEGGLTKARVQQARADVEAAQVLEQQTRDGVALETKQAILSMENAAERMAAAAKTVEQAKEALRLAKVRYQEGVSIALEVTDAQAALTQAETDLVNARYDYLVARARYQRAVGLAVERPEEAASTPAASGSRQ